MIERCRLHDPGDAGEPSRTDGFTEGVMTDNLTAEQRRRAMAAVHGRSTSPERQVRSVVRRLGYRFRANVANINGKPDLVFHRHRAVIFIHGCFWHGHACQRRRPRPATNAAYWRAKVKRNQERDRGVVRTLRSTGWRVLVLWECQVQRPGLAGRLSRFLRAGTRRSPLGKKRPSRPALPRRRIT